MDHNPTEHPRLLVQVGAAGRRASWLPVADFAAASRACREFIKTHDLGASTWRGGRILDATTNEPVAMVSYNGRVWLADGREAVLQRIDNV